MNDNNMNGFDLRGMLASKLTCWHRLTETEASELLKLVAGLAKPAPAPMTRKELRSMWLKTAIGEQVPTNAQVILDRHEQREDSNSPLVCPPSITTANVKFSGLDYAAEAAADYALVESLTQSINDINAKLAPAHKAAGLELLQKLFQSEIDADQATNELSSLIDPCPPQRKPGLFRTGIAA